MAEAVNNLLNFWKSHNISLSTNDLPNSSVNYSYPSVDNVFTTSITNEIPAVESESVFTESTSSPAKTAPSPAQTTSAPNAHAYQAEAYRLNLLKAEIEELEKNKNLNKKQKEALIQKKKAYNKGVNELKGMYSESFEGKVANYLKPDSYQELEIPKRNKSKRTKKKKTQANDINAKENSSKEKAEKASKIKEKSVEKSNETATEKSVEKSNKSPKDKATENPVKEQKEVSKEVKPAEKAEKPTKSKVNKPSKKGKLSKFKGKKGKFGAILAGIALVGAAIAYVVNKASDKVDKAGDKVDKAKDVKAEKPVENTTQIEETPEIVEQIPVAPVEAPVQEENDGDVVTVKPGDTVWDLCEQKLKECGNGNPTAKQIRELVDKVMADEDNKLHWESDNYTVIIEPGQEIKIRKPEKYSS